jgi:hypothetical protein
LPGPWQLSHVTPFPACSSAKREWGFSTNFLASSAWQVSQVSAPTNSSALAALVAGCETAACCAPTDRRVQTNDINTRHVATKSFCLICLSQRIFGIAVPGPKSRVGQQRILHGELRRAHGEASGASIFLPQDTAISENAAKPGLMPSIRPVSGPTTNRCQPSAGFRHVRPSRHG